MSLLIEAFIKGTEEEQWVGVGGGGLRLGEVEFRGTFRDGDNVV